MTRLRRIYRWATGWREVGATRPDPAAALLTATLLVALILGVIAATR